MLRLAQSGIERDAGDSLRTVGHQQDRVLELSHQFGCKGDKNTQNKIVKSDKRK